MTPQGRGAGLAGPATAENKSKGDNRNFAPDWRVVQRKHELRAVALAASGRRQSSCPPRARARA